jgi:Na+-transporting NADH:ubiquinone oxidoreductase subunit F
MQNTANKRKAVYFFGANSPEELFMGDDMQQFEKNLADYRYVPVVARLQEGQKWPGETGLVTEAVQRGLKDASQYEAYLCGSPGMIDASVDVLKGLGVEEDNIFYDKFA